MVSKKTNRKVKALPARGLSNRQARDVKGGGFSPYVNFGDIKGESSDKNPKDWMEMMLKR